MLLFFKAVSHITQKMSLRNSFCQPGPELAVGMHALSFNQIE